MVDTCAGEFEAVTPYFYSAYSTANEAVDEEFSRHVTPFGPRRGRRRGVGQGKGRNNFV